MDLLGGCEGSVLDCRVPTHCSLLFLRVSSPEGGIGREGRGVAYSWVCQSCRISLALATGTLPVPAL